jgi:hypothetical protein
MSPTADGFAGSTGATLTRCRLRIKGTIDEPLGATPPSRQRPPCPPPHPTSPIWYSVIDQP